MGCEVLCLYRDGCWDRGEVAVWLCPLVFPYCTDGKLRNGKERGELCRKSLLTL